MSESRKRDRPEVHGLEPHEGDARDSVEDATAGMEDATTQNNMNLPQMTRDEVVTRNLRGAKLIAIDNIVYDVNNFMATHPGGAVPFLRHIDSGCFPDATKSFYVVHPDGPYLLNRFSDVVKPVGQVVDPIESRWVAKTFDNNTDRRPPHPNMAINLFQRAVSGAIGLAWDGAGLLVSSVYWSLIRPLEVMTRQIAPVAGDPVRADGKPTRVAIVGGDQTEGFDFTVFEKKPRVGGHAKTVLFDMNDENNDKEEEQNTYDEESLERESINIPVDMGFIFGNKRSYSNLLELMENVGAKANVTELSVAADVFGHQWATSASHCNGMQGKTKMHPEAQAECRRFHDMCTRLSENPALNVFPFDKLLDMMSFSQKWRDIYLSPLLNILFLDTKHMYKTSARFMCNIFGGKNKIIDLLEGQEAFTVQGGTQDTWNRVRACFPERVKTDCGVAYVKRQPPGTISGEEGPTVLVVLEDGTHHVFDHVVLCLNGRAAALLLNNGSTMTSLERLFFSQVRYNTEISYLHTDSTFLPEMEMTRNFNYFETTEMDHPQLTGSMIHVGNRPEGLLAPNGHNTRDVKQIPLLTTSPHREIEEEKIVKEWWGSLHVQDLRHVILTRTLLPQLQGNNGIWFGGSWANWMGHSGAVDAGMCCAVRLGANYPLTNHFSRSEFFRDCCQDMFGPRFDWERNVRKFKVGCSPEERKILRKAHNREAQRKKRVSKLRANL